MIGYLTKTGMIRKSGLLVVHTESNFITFEFALRGYDDSGESTNKGSIFRLS